MKVMGEGELRHDPQCAIQYQLAAPVDAFVIGMENRVEVDENVYIVSTRLPQSLSQTSNYPAAN